VGADECDQQEHATGAVCRAQGTTAFVVADAEGNVVAVTQTLGTWGGNFYVTPGLGFLYNDKLTSYGNDPEAYGARIPFARHGSTISPTIVFRGEGAAMRPVLTLGAAGNAWITSAVYQTLVGVLDLGLSAQQALELPRFLPSRGFGAGSQPSDARPPQVDLEDGMAPAVMRQLDALGYRVNRISLRGELRMGYGAAITIGPNSVTAGADPRRSGAAGAVPQ
jgi:gamma-glutamyltranspeptidase